MALKGTNLSWTAESPIPGPAMQVGLLVHLRPDLCQTGSPHFWRHLASARPWLGSSANRCTALITSSPTEYVLSAALTCYGLLLRVYMMHVLC